jgi:beta-glucosidase
MSARWTSTLVPPSTGEYKIFYEGNGVVKIIIDGKEVINKKVDGSHRAETLISLVAGQKYDLRIECAGINKYAVQRLGWQPPFDANKLTPEKAAKQADIAIIFLRDMGGMEGRDRTTLAINSVQEELVSRVVNANPNTVLVLGSGTPLILGKLSKQVKALLNVWIAGQGEAQAIADILSGQVNPSGKTPVTFFADEKQLPALDDYNVTNGRSYQYFKGDVLYPFGFGLSYNQYEYARPKLKQQHVERDGLISVSVKITNKGKYDGEEVVQCYVSSKAWKAGGLKQKLVAFDRIFLKKGESGVLEFQIPVSELSRWNVEKDYWEVHPGEYKISVVPHSGVENVVTFTVL